MKVKYCINIYFDKILQSTSILQNNQACFSEDILLITRGCTMPVTPLLSLAPSLPLSITHSPTHPSTLSVTLLSMSLTDSLTG